MSRGIRTSELCFAFVALGVIAVIKAMSGKKKPRRSHKRLSSRPYGLRETTVHGSSHQDGADLSELHCPHCAALIPQADLRPSSLPLQTDEQRLTQIAAQVTEPSQTRPANAPKAPGPQPIRRNPFRQDWQ
jgi:hypothetical protein